MIKEYVSILGIVALLYGAAWAMPRIDLWMNDCGAGVMVKGYGGYWYQSKEECGE